MTLQEMDILNNAVGGGAVPLMPEFPVPGMSLPMVHAAKDMLAGRGLLADHDTFTDAGVLMAKRLADFKNAGEHVRIFDMAVGIVDDGKAVMVSRTAGDGYDITLTSIDAAARRLLDEFRQKPRDGGAEA